MPASAARRYKICTGNQMIAEGPVFHFYASVRTQCDREKIRSFVSDFIVARRLMVNELKSKPNAMFAAGC